VLKSKGTYTKNVRIPETENHSLVKYSFVFRKIYSTINKRTQQNTTQPYKAWASDKNFAWGTENLPVRKIVRTACSVQVKRNAKKNVRIPETENHPLVK